MPSKFGHGFVVNLVLIGRHLGLPTEKAFLGLADHLDQMVLPEQFKGTEVEKLYDQMRRRILWHQAGTTDKEELPEVKRLFDRLVVAVDQGLDIPDADIGSFA
jgi:hypothetical protein